HISSMRLYDIINVLPTDYCTNATCAIGNAFCVLLILELRRYDIINNSLSSHVCQLVAYAVCNFDSHLMIALGNVKQNTILLVLAADPPLTSNIEGRAFNILALGD